MATYNIVKKGERKTSNDPLYAGVSKELMAHVLISTDLLDKGHSKELKKFINGVYRNLKARAKRQKVEFSVTKDGLRKQFKDQAGLSALTRKPMQLTVGTQGHPNDYKATVTRKFPNYQYTDNNIMFVRVAETIGRHVLSTNEYLKDFLRAEDTKKYTRYKTPDERFRVLPEEPEEVEPTDEEIASQVVPSVELFY
jgi:hypothetical protein